MEPKFQTSFIPKKPIVGGPNDPAGMSRPISLFSVIASIIFVIVALTSGALFAYKQILTKQIADASASIDSARAAFEPNTIEQLIDVSTRITLVEQLLNSHIVTSQLFALLQTLTLKNITFNNFQFSNDTGVYNLSMDVEGRSYNALAEQLNVFTQTSSIHNPSFSGFTVLNNGDISTKFSATVDPNVVSYASAINSGVNQ